MCTCSFIYRSTSRTLLMRNERSVNHFNLTIEQYFKITSSFVFSAYVFDHLQATSDCELDPFAPYLMMSRSSQQD